MTIKEAIRSLDRIVQARKAATIVAILTAAIIGRLIIDPSGVADDFDRLIALLELVTL